MSAPARGGRGGRGRGKGPRSADATENSRRGRASLNMSNGIGRDLQKTLSRGGATANLRQPPRGPRGSTANARISGSSPAPSRPSLTNGGASPAGIPTPRRPVSGTPEERWAQLRKLREKEREDAMRDGYIVDPEKPRALSEAVTPVGRCPDMCPEFERASRIYQNEVWNAEKVAITTKDGETKMVVDESRMVKKFRRSAAGLDEQLPSDLRPPQVLLVRW
jgi:hypothetical protein